jgi:hypothetical protein
LNIEELDTLTKHFLQLCVILIDEASLIQAVFLYKVEKCLQQIKQTLTSYFGDVDLIFPRDMCQTQPTRNSMIFEEQVINKQKNPYAFLSR